MDDNQGHPHFRKPPYFNVGHDQIHWFVLKACFLCRRHPFTRRQRWNSRGWGPKCGSYSFSPNSVSTLRSSYGSSKGRCFIRVLTLGRGIFPVNFRIKWLLWNHHMHFDCAGSNKVCVRVLGSIWGAAFFSIHFRKKWLLWHVDVHFHCAGSCKVWS